MSRSALKRLVNACERSPALRQSLKACSSVEEWIAVAGHHGFPITPKDLDSDAQESQLSRWFEQSRIRQPFRAPRQGR
ncbi:MAG: Nif11-like leader peptide family natural product precursor [Cyanobacteriota bacterium]|nr:Nif11-like leader peptide family natural product precursor [Cyanobacteriota bacterium]